MQKLGRLRRVEQRFKRDCGFDVSVDIY